MQESLLNTYAMLQINTYGKLLFSAGSSYYHNGIAIGLAEMEKRGIIELEWKLESIPDKWLEPTAKKELEPVNQVWIRKKKELPSDLDTFQFLFQWLPEDEPMNLIDLVEVDYRYEINREVTCFQDLMEQELVEKHMAELVEKKGFFGRFKMVLKLEPEYVRQVAGDMQDQLSQRQELSEEELVLYYLAKTERMLPKMFNKQDAKVMYEMVEQVTSTPIFRESTFIRLIELMEFLEDNVFISFTLDN